MNAQPILTVVIPTHKRPQYLPRAIGSALRAAPDGDVEVIVVPNGPDQSWKSVVDEFRSDPRVRWLPIRIAHANVARNHGLSNSRGKYLRFLDDDDYLLPAASEQIEMLETNGWEICSGFIENVDEDGGQHGLLSFPNTDDFICAATAFSGFALPTAHVFLRSHLEECRWDTTLNRRQDYGWMLDLSASREWNWGHINKVVGAWFQHRGERISHPKVMKERDQPVIDKLLVLHTQLAKAQRLDDTRNAAIAGALWHHAHLGFPYQPRYSTHVARRALEICPTARPPNPLFVTGLMRRINPIIGEWMLLPVRRFALALRSLIKIKRGVTYKRNL